MHLTLSATKTIQFPPRFYAYPYQLKRDSIQISRYTSYRMCVSTIAAYHALRSLMAAHKTATRSNLRIVKVQEGRIENYGDRIRSRTAYRHEIRDCGHAIVKISHSICNLGILCQDLVPILFWSPVLL